MDVGRTLDVAARSAWRAWLRKNHRRAREVWLVFRAKGAERPSLPYNDAVDEALCFGWIDSTVKPLGPGRRAQRFTPRRPGAPISEMNKARVRRLVRERRMTKAGLDALGHVRDLLRPAPLVLRPDVRRALQRNPATWRRYQRLPAAYRRIRIGFIEGARGRPAEFRRRLRHFVAMTSAGKRFGMVQG